MKKGSAIESDSNYEGEPDKPIILKKKKILKYMDGLRNYISSVNDDADRVYD